MTAFISLVDALPYGVFLIDAEGCVTFRNREAQALLADADGLVLSDRCLHALRKSDEARLQRLIAKARTDSPGPHATALERPSGRHAYGILVLPPDARQLSRERLAAVLVSDPERQTRLDEDAVRHLFSLTRAEAALVALLVDGLTLQQAAAEQKIATRTARVHLRNIFRKIGARRQSDLVRIVCMSVAMLAPIGESAAVARESERITVSELAHVPAKSGFVPTNSESYRM